MSTQTITLDRADCDRLRECVGLADVLLDQVESVLRLGDVGRMD
ncbi:hypothetical protein [Paraburkholderia sp. J63]|nr:hypothetical protein [Paraburkholderia sp. J63]